MTMGIRSFISRILFYSPFDPVIGDGWKEVLQIFFNPLLTKMLFCGYKMRVVESKGCS